MGFKKIFHQKNKKYQLKVSKWTTQPVYGGPNGLQIIRVVPKVQFKYDLQIHSPSLVLYGPRDNGPARHAILK